MAEIEQPQPLDQVGESTEAKRRTRRGSRGGRGRRRPDGQPEGAPEAPEEPAALAPEPETEAAPAAPKTRAPRRTRAKPAAETAPAAEQPEAVAAPLAEPAPEAPKRPTRGRRAPKATTEPVAEEAPAAAPEQPATRPPRAPKAAPQPIGDSASAILRAVEQQQKQIDQLVRLHEDLAKRVGSHGGGGAAAPPARVGVFVDAANIELACDRLRARFDWRKILDMVTKDRLLVRAIAYSPVHDDPGVSIETQRFVEPFLDKGFKVVTKPLKRFADGTIKANVDIELALDIIEMLDRLDVVVLASGDGDFQRLVEVIQAKGIRVEVLSVGASTASNLRHAADKFIDLQTRLRELRAG